MPSELVKRLGNCKLAVDFTIYTKQWLLSFALRSGAASHSHTVSIYSELYEALQVWSTNVKHVMCHTKPTSFACVSQVPNPLPTCDPRVAHWLAGRCKAHLTGDLA